VWYLRQDGRGHCILFLMEQQFFVGNVCSSFVWNICSSLFLMCRVFCMIWAFLAVVLPRILLFRDVLLCCWVIPDIQSRKMFLDCLILNFDARCWTPLHPTTQHFEVKKILILKHSCCQCLQTYETFLGFVREERTN